jgi:phospholipase/carboxylesterase
MGPGIHHVTLIARKVQANVDFYAGFLGLRLVKRTAGFEDAAQLHLFYGDAHGSPGSLVSFLVWEDGAPGRAGHGQVGEIAFAIAPESIGFWLTRALSAGLQPSGPAEEFTEPVLRLKDPDGVTVKLVGAGDMASAAPWSAAGIPAEHAVRRLRGATLLSELPEATRTFLEENFGYGLRESAGSVTRMASASGDVVDIRDARGFWPGAPGTGTVDHIAFRAADAGEIDRISDRLRETAATATNVHDRKYFRSFYVREPGGILFELATDRPGMVVDEDPGSLGTGLFIPPSYAGQEEDIRVILPQFALPGRERVVYRDLPFVHRFFTPAEPDGTTLVLLHGSGGNETSLLPFAAKAAPRSVLLGIRGRSVEEGSPRWFRRHATAGFDQDDIRSEAEAFAAFVEGAAASYRLDPESTVFLGHSNGANFLSAFLQLYPHLVRRAVLLRPMPVLDEAPAADLPDLDALVVAGERDSYAPRAPELAAVLREGGARVEEIRVAEGHDVGDADIQPVGAWLRGERQRPGR